MLLASSQPQPFCRGFRVRTNVPCGIHWDLDALGYCVFHTPLALQCRGIAISTGQRCNRRVELDANVMCVDHGRQVPICHFVDEATGTRCGHEDVNMHGFCGRHPARAEDVLRGLALMTLGNRLVGLRGQIPMAVPVRRGLDLALANEAAESEASEEDTASDSSDGGDFSDSSDEDEAA